MFDCAKYNWDHKLLIQVAQKTNQVAACIESLRNVLHADSIGAQALIENFVRFLNANTVAIARPGALGARERPELLAPRDGKDPGRDEHSS